MERILFYILISGACMCFISAIVYLVVNLKNKRKYGRVSSSIIFAQKAEKINKILSRNRYCQRLINEISYKISVFNSISFEKNRQISIFLILGFVYISIKHYTYLCILAILVYFFIIYYLYIFCFFVFI